jgi:hypothetical protein
VIILVCPKSLNLHCYIAVSDNKDFGFGIDEENDGDELIRFTQDKNAKKHDYIPSRTKKIRTESFVVKRPCSKKKSGNKLKFICKKNSIPINRNK